MTGSWPTHPSPFETKVRLQAKRASTASSRTEPEVRWDDQGPGCGARVQTPELRRVGFVDSVGPHRSSPQVGGSSAAAELSLAERAVPRKRGTRLREPRRLPPSSPETNDSSARGDVPAPEVSDLPITDELVESNSRVLNNLCCLGVHLHPTVDPIATVGTRLRRCVEPEPWGAIRDGSWGIILKSWTFRPQEIEEHMTARSHKTGWFGSSHPVSGVAGHSYPPSSAPRHVTAGGAFNDPF